VEMRRARKQWRSAKAALVETEQGLGAWRRRATSG
jgi:hypothetical protein